MKAAVGVSRHLDLERACLDATEQALLSLGKETAPDLLWCVTVDHPVAGMEHAVAAMQKRSGAREVLANTAAGLYVAPRAQEVEGEPTVGVMLIHGDPELDIWSGRTRRPPWRGRPTAVLVDPDAGAAGTLTAVQELVDPERLAGGAAMGVETDALVLHHGVGAVDHAAVGMGAGVCEVVLAQGCAPLGDALTVTAVDGNLVLELDGEPALGRILEQLGPRERADAARSLARCSVGLAEVGDAQGIVEGRYCVRRLVGVAPDIGAIAIAEVARVGQPLALVRSDGPLAERALSNAVTRLKNRLAGAVPRAALYFSCAGRGRRMYGRPNVDVEVLQRALPRVPILGMASGFELGPGRSGPSMHMFSGVLMVLAEGS
ncbi:MAG: FIST C-terminal domain-containing protein [Myxococcota bacterium]